jgi:hypothetical protein
MLRHIGMSRVALGLVTGLFGLFRYWRMDKRIRRIRDDMRRAPGKKKGET